MKFQKEKKVVSPFYYISMIINIRPISKFMKSQPGQQTIKIHILPNTSQSKDNQAMKFCQLMEYNKRNIFFKKHGKNEARRLVPDLFLFFKNALRELKASGLQLSFNIFRWS